MSHLLLQLTLWPWDQTTKTKQKAKKQKTVGKKQVDPKGIGNEVESKVKRGQMKKRFPGTVVNNRRD